MWNRRHGEDGDTPTCSIYINNSCQSCQVLCPVLPVSSEEFSGQCHHTYTFAYRYTVHIHIQAILQNILDHASKMKEESLVKDPPLPARPWNSSF